MDTSQNIQLESKAFSKGDAIRYGWGVTKNHLGFFIILLLIVGAIMGVFGVLENSFKDNAKGAASVISVVGIVVRVLVSMGLVKIVLNLIDGKKGEYGDLFSQYPIFFKYLGGSILYGLIVFGGMILLIVPGVIWAIKYQYYSYCIIDRGLGPVRAIKQSGLVTQGAKWNLWLFMILLVLLNIGGALLLGIGLFLTIPTTLVAQAFVYRTLLDQKEASAQEASG